MATPSAQALLYQFPLSHYCEKIRWQLDFKGIPYRTINMFPGTHTRMTMKLAGTRTLPILVDGDKAIGDSTAIALYLEDRYPGKPLLPVDESERRQALEIEAFCDELGDYVRRWVYSHMISHPDLGKMLFNAYPIGYRTLGRMMMPLMRVGLKKLYRVHPKKIVTAEEKMWAGLDRLGEILQGRTQGYLAGNQFSLADIAAASMYGPLLAPPGTPWEHEGAMSADLAGAIDRARAHPAGQWMMQLYQQMRR